MSKTEATQLIRYLSGALIRVNETDKSCEEFLKDEMNFFMDKLDEAYEADKEKLRQRSESKP